MYMKTKNEPKGSKLKGKLKELKEGLEDLTDNVTRPISRFVWAVRHRTINRFNIIHIPSLSSTYWDTDSRLLHGMFALLVDFIEIEKAAHNRSDDYPPRRPLYKSLFPFLFSSRDREAGLAYLTWEINLPQTDPGCQSQADAAKEQLDLYLWWKDIRPTRQDPMDESGWSDFCDRTRDRSHKFKELPCGNFELYDELTVDEKAEQTALLNKMIQIEAQQDQEDEDMLIRLVKVRRCLWT